MRSFSYKDRWQSLKKLREKEFDLVIVGGGINGAGVARDAALRGMSVALIEEKDFASGTSSRSSKLIHGGIRYLENYEFHLVFEALSERKKLFELAPHLVHPLRFLIPIFKDSRVGMGMMGLGMWLYDALALFDAPQGHERLDPAETLRRMPDLRRENLAGSYEYSDAYMDDDRLTIETLRSANEHGAVAVTFVKAIGLESKDGRANAVIAQDTETGDKFAIRGRHILSTVGAWTDELGAALFKDWKKVLRPTKGIHIVLDRNRIPLTSALVLGAESRIVFAIPRHEMLIIGTTDTDFKGDPDGVTPTPDEVEYLLKVFHSYFPGANVKPHDIISSYAGVRPLVQDGSSSEGKTSREHTIWTGPEGVTFVGGGKYTTYRLIAEQTVKHVLKQFPIEDRVRFGRSQSTQPLNPLIHPEHLERADSYAPDLARGTALMLDEAVALLHRHGGEAFEITKKFDKNWTYWQLEAAHAIVSTMCFRLEDFYLRRVPLFLGFRDHGLPVLDEVGVVFQSLLGWSASELENQKEALRKRIAHELAWQSALD